MDKYDEMEEEPKPHKELQSCQEKVPTKESILKNTEVTQALDTTNLVIPKDEKMFEDRKTKLALDNVSVPIDHTLPT